MSKMLHGIPFPGLYGPPSTLFRKRLLQSITTRRQQIRCISTSWLNKQAENKAEWAEQAKQIENGEKQHLWDFFKERGYIKDIAGNEEQMRELMRLERIGAYVGIDPTAPSLHIGHLLPLMPLFWMYIHGYRAVTLIGGATAKIGDPSGRLKSRAPMSWADTTRNITKTHYQLKLIWSNLEVHVKRYGFEKKSRTWSRALANNTSFYSSLPFTELAVRLFRGVRLSTLLSRETVKNRLEKGDGMSLDEFIYPMMQAWDFWQLFDKLGVRMQIGGSDQFGNIVSGVEYLKFIRDSDPDERHRLPDNLSNTPFGFTTPLLTDSAGNKFGKSAGNALWLDPFMTSSFDLYGYWMRQPDHDMERLLKLFTFIPSDEITKIVEEHNQDPPKRVAQHRLAFEVLSVVHSAKQAQDAQNRHKGLFSKGSTEVTVYPSDVPADAALAAAFQTDIKLPESLILGKSISRILYAAGLADSVSDAHRLVKHQGSYIGGRPGKPTKPDERAMETGELTFTPIKNWFVEETKNYLIDGKILILRRGKHFIRIVEMVSDEEWAKSGMTYAGEPGSGRVRYLRKMLQKFAESEKLSNDPETVENLIARAKDLWANRGPKTMPPNRAAEILRNSIQPYWTDGTASVKSKTKAIDYVIEQAKAGLEDYDRMEEEQGSKNNKDHDKFNDQELFQGVRKFRI
ncbi:hypothetical protein F5B19DRAFT_476195 [Rostrohypoxylon terebratum]|nr:hypothetical protein F5B19DRAFT_476195 [Rostrohypoxylon terebratum]